MVACVKLQKNNTQSTFENIEIQSTVDCKNLKLELLADKKVRHTFASKVASLLRELPDFTEDVVAELDLFISAAANCGCKRWWNLLGGPVKRTAWCNQEVKERSYPCKNCVYRLVNKQVI